MEKSKVYFTNMRASFQENLPQKMRRLMKTAGIADIDFENKYTAIKMHFGEPGNLAFLRPNYAAVIADSQLDRMPHVHHDHFTDSAPTTNWKSCLEHAEKIGIGTQEYELIEI